ncbi:hypothetical protein GIB67_028837 [Kingdonia uniflora]|uniref:Uncharacterized protein n=1 Tax=Kingdonia uniflora TaxID=39325 RepID=A0A7J7LTI3_9MAGN|nr:hypothetical protein GIB67_028837 [Kingdonia uniflora]
MHTCLKIMASLVDIEEKSFMTYIYSTIEDCKLKVKTNSGDQNEDNRELWKIIKRIFDRRWSGMLQKPLDVVAYYLNPQYYYATLTSSDEMKSNTKLKDDLLDCIAKLTLDKKDESQILRNLIVYRNKAGRLGKRSAQACVKTIAPGHDRMRDLAYIQYNKRLKKRYEERISGKEINPIVLKSLDECAEWLIPDDARYDIVLGTNITYGVLEGAKDGLDDFPLIRTSRTNTASHCLQGGASSLRSTTRHLQEFSMMMITMLMRTTMWVMEMMMALTRDPTRTFDFIIQAKCFYSGVLVLLILDDGVGFYFGYAKILFYVELIFYYDVCFIACNLGFIFYIIDILQYFITKIIIIY